MTPVDKLVIGTRLASGDRVFERDRPPLPKLVELFNLFRQKQIANDIWKASAWISSGIFVAIGGGRVSNANSGTAYSYSSLHMERSGLCWTQVGLVVAIAAAVLAIVLASPSSAARALSERNFPRAPGVLAAGWEGRGG